MASVFLMHSIFILPRFNFL